MDSGCFRSLRGEFGHRAVTGSSGLRSPFFCFKAMNQFLCLILCTYAQLNPMGDLFVLLVDSRSFIARIASFSKGSQICRWDLTNGPLSELLELLDTQV